MHLSTPFRVPRRGSSQFCRIEIAPRRFSLPLCRITTGTRGAGGVVRVRTVIRESFHPLKSETLLRLLHRHQFLLHGPTISRLHVYAKYVCLSLRQQATKHRTSCNHIMLLERAAANHREREREREKERGREKARGLVVVLAARPVLKPERRLPWIEITANGSTGQRERTGRRLSESTTTHRCLWKGGKKRSRKFLFNDKTIYRWPRDI